MVACAPRHIHGARTRRVDGSDDLPAPPARRYTLFESYWATRVRGPLDPRSTNRILAERGLKKPPNPVIQMIYQFPDTRSE